MPQMLGMLRAGQRWTRQPRVVAFGLAVLLTAVTAAGLQLAHPGSAYSQTANPGKTRTYFISADEVRWNYAPAGSNLITGQPFGDRENTYVKQGPDRIGSTYLKALYREYTDGTFSRLKTRPADQAYLGDLGPIIRAEVGDTIRVIYRNNTRFPTSIHPHGVFYTKSAEGAPYNDSTSGAEKADDAVPPHGTFTYVWQVPERAGPGDMDASSVMWMYHSHTDEVSDTYSGLIGAMEITRRGSAKPDGSPIDVDQEIFTNFMVADENQSPYIDQNIALFTGDPGSVNKDDEEFQESNLMHSINGYVYGNMPMITIHRGARVRWYTMDMGTEVDLHSPHWHGNTLLVNGMRMDVVQLLPGGMVTGTMVPDDPGTWLFHCHVNDHILAGMLTRYQVV
jgi:manganese oxidase